MGIITWQNVPTGDLSAAQEGIRTASALFDRAAKSGMEATAQAQAIQDAQKKAAQDAADKVLMAKMSAVQDPAQLKQALAAGTLVDPAIAQAASVDALLRANSQVDVLQKRDQADQTLLDDKQKYGITAFNDQRNRQLIAQNDAMSPLITQFSELAQNNPAAAMKAFREEASRRGLQIDAETAIKVGQHFHQLFIDPSNAIRAQLERQKFDMMNEANALKGYVRQHFNNENYKDAAKFLDNYTKTHPNQKYGATILETVMQDISREDPEFFKNVASVSNARMGVSPDAVPRTEFHPELRALNNQVEKSTLGLGTGDRIVLEAKDSGLQGASSATIAENMAKLHPNWKVGEFTAAIEKIVSSAPKDRPLTPVEAAGVIMNSLDQDGVTTFKDFMDGIDRREWREKDLVKNINSSRDRVEAHSNLIRERDNFQRLNDRLAELMNKEKIIREAAGAGRDPSSAPTETMKTIKAQMQTVRDDIAKKAAELKKAEEEAQKAQEGSNKKEAQNAHANSIDIVKSWGAPQLILPF